MPDNAPPPIHPPPIPTVPSESQARTWNMLCHLSALSGFIIPLGNVLGPLLVWQIKKNEFPSVEAHGKAALNFQLTVLIALMGIFIVGFIGSFFCVGFLIFLLLPVVGVADLILTILAGLKANEGKEYKYPFSFKLVN